jgi:hypothetical protein
VPFDEEHAAVVVRGDVADGNVAADALPDDDALLAVGELVASELALRAGGRHDAAFGWRWLQRAAMPCPLISWSRLAVASRGPLLRPSSSASICRSIEP